MKIEILPSAIEDLYGGRKFYEKQGEGLGEYFFNALFAGIHPKVFGCFRLLAKRFPYAIYYKTKDSQTVVVQRVLDLRQHPQKTQDALE